MPAQSIQTDAFVLLKRLPADAFQSYTLFSVGYGLLFALQRVPKSGSGTSIPLDLFDEAAVILESSNQGRTWFLKEARILVRHPTMGRAYETLQAASSLASLIARNAVEEASRPAVAELLRGAFGALASGARPDIVYFKCLYRFARDEGYPLKQQWFPTLPSADQAEVSGLLNLPAAGQTASPAAVARLQRRLEEYLRGHTEILLE